MHKARWMTRACMVYGGTVLVMLQMGNVLNAGPVLQYAGCWLGVWIDGFSRNRMSMMHRAEHLVMGMLANCRKMVVPHNRQSCPISKQPACIRPVVQVIRSACIEMPE